MEELNMTECNGGENVSIMNTKCFQPSNPTFAPFLYGLYLYVGCVGQNKLRQGTGHTKRVAMLGLKVGNILYT
jgi:hypothetical protein